MFYNHATDFARFAPAIAAPTSPCPSATLSCATLIEAQQGWIPAGQLQTGEAVATYDGGFVRVSAIQPTDVTSPMVLVPGGILGACSDAALPGPTHVVLDLDTQTPPVTVPLSALCGWRGIRPTLTGATDLTTIHLDSEELIYAHTGLLIHTAPGAQPFFEQLSYGDTRAKIALWTAGFGAPDTAAA